MLEQRHPDTKMPDGRTLGEHISDARLVLYYGGFLTDKESKNVDAKIYKYLKRKAT